MANQNVEKQTKVEFRCTKEEKEKLLAEANKRGVSLSALMRTEVFNNAGASSKYTVEYRSYLENLTHIAAKMCENDNSEDCNLFNGYQPLFGIHTDNGKYHLHLVVNSVNKYTGKKLHMNPMEFEKLCLAFARELTLLKIALLPYTYYDENRGPHYGKVSATWLYEYKTPYD